MVIKKSENQAHPIRPQAAYLIRCWREGETWRYSVEEIASRRRRRYDSVGALLAALRIRLIDEVEGESLIGGEKTV